MYGEVFSRAVKFITGLLSEVINPAMGGVHGVFAPTCTEVMLINLKDQVVASFFNDINQFHAQQPLLQHLDRAAGSLDAPSAGWRSPPALGQPVRWPSPPQGLAITSLSVTGYPMISTGCAA